MSNKVKLKTSMVILASLLFTGCSTLNSQNAPEVSPDGLKLKHETRSTVAYKKSGVDFSEYDKVLIVPSTVAFKKNWQRDYNRSATTLSTRIKDNDVLRIKSSVAKLLDEVFIEEFTRNNGYPIVKEPTQGVLLIKPAIINLDVNAPTVTTASITRTITEDSGSATLYLELFDAVSGEILARIIDKEKAGDNGYYQWSTRVTNHADAKRVIRKWAKSLRESFDKAHDKATKD